MSIANNDFEPAGSSKEFRKTVPDYCKKTNAPPHTTKIYHDYSHRSLIPYGPEADSQLPASYKYRYVDEQHPEGFSA
ncbi:MAG: hypothetical protein JXA79_00020 [Deltaproteobacteria bacterium]|nr:hypothetical protein [Deltaproteobacteria bacterium]